MTVKVKWPIVNLIPPFYGKTNLLNGTEFKTGIIFSPHNRGFFIGIERIGAYLFSSDSVIYPSYVGEKLNLHPESSDAKALADFINAQILQEDVEQFAEYNPSFLRKDSHGSFGRKILGYFLGFDDYLIIQPELIE